jgi:hypothetical protein
VEEVLAEAEAAAEEALLLPVKEAPEDVFDPAEAAEPEADDPEAAAAVVAAEAAEVETCKRKKSQRWSNRRSRAWKCTAFAKSSLDV